MKLKIQGVFVTVAAAVAVSACSHQQVAPEPMVMAPDPVVVEEPVVIPAPQPYHDTVVKPAPMKPAPLPPVVKPKPAPVQPQPVMTAQPQPVYVPQVKAKGNYRGSIPISSDLRQQYQQ
ncbi:MAG: hypothetical protein R3F02_15395 [Thiolinea sp.]